MLLGQPVLEWFLALAALLVLSLRTRVCLCLRCCLLQLEKVVAGADHGPFASDTVQAKEQQVSASRWPEHFHAKWNSLALRKMQPNNVQSVSGEPT
ncbi:MAG: hypothetical protein INF75_06630 [Roseomonas sp.]|nr:hypothetical protein [Roseomonas sp.]MCA3329035.1 hypothetical protein [Roseomonas sp.]MCA3331755.1 hypothetical protein [Roseomonas sp.]MCA3333332.1 hypothetical protein [Roseomonas sp.]MCA3347653.1 hypothetical protein [Roseomonas sp.]